MGIQNIEPVIKGFYMCSSPKKRSSSQGTRRRHVSHSLNIQALDSFTQLANAADDRRWQREEGQLKDKQQVLLKAAMSPFKNIASNQRIKKKFGFVLLFF